MPPMKKMPTVMGQGHTFAQVPSVGMNRSVFDRSHGYKTTLDAGFLVPVYVDEVLPGDTFTLKMTAFARLTTPIKPLMDNMYLESFFFFVPYRLIWPNFVKFMGEQANPGDSIAFTVPQLTVTATQYAVGSIGDYMGLVTAQHAAGTWSHSALPCRAYQLIYNQWFRDENLINTDTILPYTDGPDSANGLGYTTKVPYKRGKRHDYFTSALPFLQKGTAVQIGIGSIAPVKGIGWLTPGGTPTTSPGTMKETSPLPDRAYAFGYALNDPDIAATLHFEASTGVAATTKPMIYADLSQATALTINDFRQAVGLQQFLERDARGGTRYTELIFSHFRVKSPDARLQRSEYLGGGSTPVMISPIAQQAQTGLTGGTTALGNLAGVGAAVAQRHGFSKSFTEHGVIIGIVNVRADLTYSQGLERMWRRSTRYDFFWPVLEELGEQSVRVQEIYNVGTAALDDAVFGYQERYAEYRYKPSKVTGLMAPTAAGTLRVWNLSEQFTAQPTLGQTFIEDQTETVLDDRVAVNTEPDFYLDAFFDLKCARPMRVFGVPGLHRL